MDRTTAPHDEERRSASRRETPDRRQAIPEGGLTGLVFSSDEIEQLQKGEVVMKDVGCYAKQYFVLQGTNPEIENRLRRPNEWRGHMG